MNCKIHVRAGQLEVDFEGTEDFVKNQLIGIINTLSNIHGISEMQESKRESSVFSEKDEKNIDNPDETNKIQGTTATLAGKLNVKTGPELIIAAASRLTFVVGQEKFRREDILKEMRSAISYFKQSYAGGNLTKNFERLVKNGQLIEQSAGVFAIAANERRRLENILIA